MNWLLVGSVAAGALLARRSKAASTQCKPCYDAKSASYRACARIPAEQSAARNACFNTADLALQQCLRACGG